MTLALTYVEIDVPVCSLTYGALPCNARKASEGDPVAANFNGATYLKRGAGLTGAADSKLLTVSLWFRFGGTGTRRQVSASTTAGGSTLRARMRLAGDNRWGVVLDNAAGTTIGRIESSALTAGHVYHALLSMDLSNPAKQFIYINDVSDLSLTTTFTNDTVDFTLGDWSIGANPDGTETYSGDMAQLWFAPGVYLDLSVEANRRKFIDADGNPVDLGAAGATPTGTSPLIFLNGDISAWATNKGTGGGFTTTGTLTEGEFATGDDKCFNSIKTCQDRVDFSESEVTLRFAKDALYLPRDIDCIPSIESVSFSPATVSLGKDLGQRASLTVTFRDHPSSDTGQGFDKYLADRDYDPYRQGSFWGKFRARQPFLRGRSLRWINGVVGDDLADMEVWNFVIDSFTGPDPDGKFQIVAKDLLKLADGDRAQAPVLSSGFLSADITNSATSATLLPSGIGNSEYPASGYLCIGGNEVVSFTRSGDALTIARGQLGSAAATHKAQDRVQRVLRYSAQDAADIIYDLLTNYADVDPATITLTDWQAETAAFLGNVYTATICEPTSVAALASELIEQAALAIWDDASAQKLRLQVLRAVVTDANTFTPENTIEGSLKIKEQPDKRLSRVQVYFALKDPTKPLSNLDNYGSTSPSIDDDAEADYGSAVIKTILSRWIPAGGRAVADRLGAVQLGRYRDPPRNVQFQLQRFADTDVTLGIGYRVEHPVIQDATGALADIPIQVTRYNPWVDGRASIEAEEMLWTAPDADTGTRNIIFDSNINNVNARTVHDSLYPTPQSGDVVNFIVNAGVVIGSSSVSLIAFDVGSWPPGVTRNLIVRGRIQGAGGYGGAGGSGPSVSHGANGANGGTAIYSRYAVTVDASSGEIWGGGGGGGGGASAGGGLNFGGGGGGGAGQVAGSGGSPNGGLATQTAAGAGGARSGVSNGDGASGGGPGLGGGGGGGSVNGGIGGSAGAAGKAIDGVSYITFSPAGGDIRGPQVN